MKLVTAIAYAPEGYERNLGRAYNEIMEGTDAEYVAFLDHDATFTTKDWYHQICKIIEENPRAGLLTAKTNRIGARPQIHDQVKSHDIIEHRAEGRRLQQKYGTQVTDYPLINNNGWISGVLMVVKREAWENVKFIDGFLGVDNAFHKGVREKGYGTLLMDGVYLYHFYRADGDMSHTK